MVTVPDHVIFPIPEGNEEEMISGSGESSGDLVTGSLVDLVKTLPPEQHSSINQLIIAHLEEARKGKSHVREDSPNPFA